MKYCLLFAICFVGCHSIDSHRYFLFNYKTNEISNGKENYGAFWFKSREFPTKNYLDSSIYSCLEKDRCCYNHIIITDIYEFKDSNDFNAFGKNYEGTWTAPAQKDSVCDPMQFKFGDVRLGGTLTQDDKISGGGFYDSFYKKQK